MTTTYQDNGDGTSTVTIAYSGATAKVLNILDEAGKGMYENYPVYDEQTPFPGVIPWASLTTPQKIAVFDSYVRDMILSVARQQYVSDEAQAAAATAEAQAQTDYNFG